ncbi:MAG: hypothetical protein IT532_18085 [Burkholderiales bacterium]|nr:hypothetical protein [Burkholderiales bacterium]
MKVTLTKALGTLALIGFGSAVGTASAHDGDKDRGWKQKHRFEQRWDRHHGHFDHRRLRARHDDRRDHRHGDYRRPARGGGERVTIILRDIFR